MINYPFHDVFEEILPDRPFPLELEEFRETSSGDILMEVKPDFFSRQGQLSGNFLDSNPQGFRSRLSK
jgi:hypothetical protein